MAEWPANVVAIVGPTAAGKSSLALQVAKRMGAELIGCDSVQIYRGFDIGSAKPNPRDQNLVPHHLIDICSFDQPFDAGMYTDRASRAVEDIRARARFSIVCGGTGLYLRSLRFGLVDLPAVPSALRERLVREERAEPGCLLRRLKQIDPDIAQQIDCQNPVRVQRALEMYELIGERPSIIRKQQTDRPEVRPIHVFAIDRPDDVLKDRIHRRTQHMLEQGLVGEVETLLAMGCPKTAKPMASVGYKQVVQHIDGTLAISELAGEIARATWQYVRRQRTWLRREPGVQWLGQDERDAVRVIETAISS